MARKFNTIPVIYWEDVRETGLSANEVLVDFYLLTTPSSNSIGIFRESPYTIAQYLDLEVHEIREAMDALETKGRLRRDGGDWLFIIKRWEYEPTKNRNTVKGAQNLLGQVNKNLALRFVETHKNRLNGLPKALQSPLDTLLVPLQSPIDTPSIPYRKTETETETNSDGGTSSCEFCPGIYC